VKGKLVLAAVAVVVLLVAITAVAWVALSAPGGARRGFGRGTLTGTNLALDVRFSYDSGLLTPAPYVADDEFPLRLDAASFSFYGKRLQGIGAMLAKQPGPLLYDFVGSQEADEFERWYKLRLASKPVYEDATIGGRLALHQQMTYELAGAQSFWPPYFPATVRQGNQACIEGWALFTDQDLFFFYAIGAQPLTSEQRAACVKLLNSLKFGAVAPGEAETPAPPAQSEAPSQAQPPVSAPPEDQTSPPAASVPQ